ncbi:MAG TPA: aldo/keto reductase [Pyrinomonadaceae bacterium]|jgi:aryl-alcohol dehydrogenase-like predicted oxidoreductase
MKYRTFGRTGWQVSEIGYGMWGMGGWTGSDDAESLASLQRAVELGCNFFDTAWVYGNGHSEQILARLLKQNASRKLYVATKIPPKNLGYPAKPEYTLEESYPPAHIEEYVHKSLENLGVETFDLIQLHTWNDRWLEDDRWLKKLEELRSQKLFSAIGISLNRWEPWNGVKAVRSGAIDAVQVVYNIFDQNPQDELFPACVENNVAVIARVPFDEGSLTGNLTRDTTFPADDWRSRYFNPENLIPTVERVEKLKEILPAEMSLPEMALRFILADAAVSTVIPGMRKTRHVEANLAASGKEKLSAELMEELKKHRWVRLPKP